MLNLAVLKWLIRRPIALGLMALSPTVPASAEGWFESDRTPVVVTLQPEALKQLTAASELEPLQSWFLSGGEPAQVVAVDKGPAEVVVVRDPRAQPYLDLLAKRVLARELAGRVAALLPGKRQWEPMLLQASDEAFLEAGREIFRTRNRKIHDAELLAARDALSDFSSFGPDTRLQFLSPMAAPVSRTVDQTTVFNLTAEMPVGERGLLSFVDSIPSLPFVHRFSDAVMTAGKQLYDAAHRRAVIVLIEGRSPDRSKHSSASVRAMLSTLQVPVFTWSFGYGPFVDAWGGFLLSQDAGLIDVAADLPAFQDAQAELLQHLESQRVIWLDGLHLAAEIELTAAARGVALAGVVPEVER
ncbi:MAG: hypothetical protein AAF560_29575 [Acidobacteriota bacterium]